MRFPILTLLLFGFVIQTSAQSILEINEQHPNVLLMQEQIEAVIEIFNSPNYTSQKMDILNAYAGLAATYSKLNASGTAFQKQFAAYTLLKYYVSAGQFFDDSDPKLCKEQLELALPLVKTMKSQVRYPLVFQDKNQESYQIQLKNVLMFEDKLHRLLGLQYYFDKRYGDALIQFQAWRKCCDIPQDFLTMLSLVSADCYYQDGFIIEAFVEELKTAREGILIGKKEDHEKYRLISDEFLEVRKNLRDKDLPVELRWKISKELLGITKALAYPNFNEIEKEIYTVQVEENMLRSYDLFDAFDYALKKDDRTLAIKSLSNLELISDNLECFELNQLSNAFSKLGDDEKTKTYHKLATKCSKKNGSNSSDDSRISFHWNYFPALTPLQKYRDWGGTAFYSHGEFGVQLGFMQINQNRDFVYDVVYPNKARRIEGQYSDWDGFRSSLVLGAVKYTTRGFGFGGVHLGYSRMNYLPQAVAWKLEADTFQQVSEVLEATMNRYELGVSYQVGFIAERFGMSIEQVLGMHMQKFDNHSHQTAKEWIPNEMLYSRKPTTFGFLWRYNFYLGWWF
jgi:hypothetical protein